MDVDKITKEQYMKLLDGITKGNYFEVPEDFQESLQFVETRIHKDCLEFMMLRYVYGISKRVLRKKFKIKKKYKFSKIRERIKSYLIQTRCLDILKYGINEHKRKCDEKREEAKKKLSSMNDALKCSKAQEDAWGAGIKRLCLPYDLYKAFHDYALFDIIFMTDSKLSHILRRNNLDKSRLEEFIDILDENYFSYYDVNFDLFRDFKGIYDKEEER